MNLKVRSSATLFGIFALLAFAGCGSTGGNQTTADRPVGAATEPTQKGSSSPSVVGPTLAPMPCEVPSGYLLKQMRATSTAVIRGNLTTASVTPRSMLGSVPVGSQTLYDVQVLETYESRFAISDTIKVITPDETPPGEYVLFLFGGPPNPFSVVQGTQGMMKTESGQLTQVCVDNSRADRPLVLASKPSRALNDLVTEIRSNAQPAYGPVGP